MAEISELLGKTLSSVERIGDEEIIFTTTEGVEYKMYHQQDCCEGVFIDDIDGDLRDLVGSPITQAEEPSTEGMPARNDEYDESFTWTFYKLATVKGYVTIKWYGSSNGYYSESVDFEKTN